MTGAAYVYDAVGRVRHAGLGWKDIRLALSEERRHWFEERKLILARTKSPLPTWKKVVRMAVYLGGMGAMLELVKWARYRPDEFPLIMVGVFLLFGLPASIVFTGIFGLPSLTGLPSLRRGRTKFRYIGGKKEIVFPDHSEWRLPRWFDWLGGVLFHHFGAKEKLPSKTSVEHALRQPGSAAPVLKPAILSGLTSEIKDEWGRRVEFQTQWPGGLKKIERATALAGRVITTTHDLPPHILTESGSYQQVLSELLNAVREFDPADDNVKHEIDRLLSRVEQIARVIDAVLEVGGIVTEKP